MAHTLPLGTHDLFVGEVVVMQISEDVVDEQGRVDNSELKRVL